jgi:hypothetical protein
LEGEQKQLVLKTRYTLGALSSRNALSVLVGAPFKNFGLFLNTPRILNLTKPAHTLT